MRVCVRTGVHVHVQRKNLSFPIPESCLFKTSETNYILPRLNWGYGSDLFWLYVCLLLWIVTLKGWLAGPLIYLSLSSPFGERQSKI